MHRDTSARSQQRRRFALACATLAAVLLVPAARAQVDPTVELSLSYYQPTFDTNVRLDSSALGVGTDINLENDLGLDDQVNQLRGELGLRISNRNRVVLDYVDFDRKGSAKLSQSIQFGDVVYAGNADVSSRLQALHTSASWRFSVVKTPISDIAVSLGASWLDLKAEITGTASATANGAPLGSAVIAESGKASGPIPLVGVHGRWWIGGALRLGADGRYFDVNDFQGWSGSIVDYSIRLDYFVLPNFAVGAGYGGTHLKADFNDGDSSGRIDYSFDGLRLTGTVAF